MSSPTSTNYKTNAESFKAYTAARMTLIPCAGFTKIPALKGFLDEPFDEKFIPEDRNYQALLRGIYLVVDCDPRAYAAGDKPLTRLLAELNLSADLFKSTLMVKTPRGGYHIYFKKPSSVPIVNSLKEFPGLEFKTGFIMACGSYIDKTDKGEPINKRYVPVYGSPSLIIDAPEELLNKLFKITKPKRPLNTVVVHDNAADVTKFTNICKQIEPAVSGKGGDQHTFKVACMGRDMGLTEETVFNAMNEYFNSRCEPAWTEEDLKTKIKNAYTYCDDTEGSLSVQNEFPDDIKDVQTVEVNHHCDPRGNVKKSLFNLKMFMKYPTVHVDKKTKAKRVLDIPTIGNYVQYCQFSNRIVWTTPAPWHKQGNEWEDSDALIYRDTLSEHIRLDYTPADIHDQALVCAKMKAFHPVRDYLQSCKWDGRARLNTWLAQYCGALDNEYTQFIGRKVLIAAVARVFRPGCKFDHVLVTEGRQGMGKSWMWAILASPWFTDAPLNIHDKSAVEVMQGKWVIELAEMDALTKYETQTIKGFLTRDEDRCRMAWARTAKSFPRQNIFVGSLNPEQTGWLKDKTGNRRYWPVCVTNIDLKALKRDRDQLWAEALKCFEEGEIIHVEDRKMIELMALEVEGRMQEDPWFWPIDNYLRENANEFVQYGVIQVVPIILYQRVILGSPMTFGQREASRITTILKTLGYEKTRSKGKIGFVYTKKYESDI